ncbi:hypothetical protein EVAR_19900_1 [Eumeta japonica]|uniref:Uncharacterized protein n=1 Tax=Eumeta variegata TaxID=151549 RepID=A0A4C1XLW3_EUMVA|nr:hypothetical protein EVAR_19900_1 [Eumeta japonica]
MSGSIAHDSLVIVIRIRDLLIRWQRADELVAVALQERILSRYFCFRSQVLEVQPSKLARCGLRVGRCHCDAKASMTNGLTWSGNTQQSELLNLT